jgi:hypothetical protein
MIDYEYFRKYFESSPLLSKVLPYFVRRYFHNIFLSAIFIEDTLCRISLLYMIGEDVGVETLY